MKLLNQSLKYLSAAIFLLLGIWSVVLYFNMQHEIKDNADEELENHKRLIIQYTASDSVIAEKNSFDESLYTLKEISRSEALQAKDRYIDTDILMQDFDDDDLELEPVRMLITTFEANGRYYQLHIANPIVEQDDLIEALLWNIVVLYFLLISSIVWVNNVVLRKVWQPFYHFLNQLKSYKIGQSKTIPHTDSQIKEFKDLEQAINTMVRYGVDALNQQKEFIANASHELQTPLAIASNKLELLFEDEQLSEMQVERLEDTYQILQRLIRINKSLLLFSKIENQQFLDIRQVSLNEVAHQSVDELSDYANFKNIVISFIDDEPISKELNPTLVSILVSNLLKNAIFHNVENGSIEISLKNNQLSIGNTGKRQALDSRMLFKRFSKGSQSEHGSGLGLAIVQAIVKHYRLQIAYHFFNGKHFFEINFS
ncbi:MAG: sensor histidine kinase [Mangrovibacterium sp.]